MLKQCFDIYLELLCRHLLVSMLQVLFVLLPQFLFRWNCVTSDTLISNACILSVELPTTLVRFGSCNILNSYTPLQIYTFNRFIFISLGVPTPFKYTDGFSTMWNHLCFFSFCTIFWQILYSLMFFEFIYCRFFKSIGFYTVFPLISTGPQISTSL